MRSAEDLGRSAGLCSSAFRIPTSAAIPWAPNSATISERKLRGYANYGPNTQAVRAGNDGFALSGGAYLR
jgi:hypothetical protein